jgi:hypothetical protein
MRSVKMNAISASEKITIATTAKIGLESNQIGLAEHRCAGDDAACRN